MRILEDNHWTNERFLFHFHDINDAKAEAQTVHAKICKPFPHYAPYWKSDYEETIKYHKDPIEPYQVSFFTNFPGWQQGKVMFAPEDDRITNQSVLQICEKIPSGKTLRKQFLERNWLRRYDLCRWDDHGWCRQLPHNVWLYIEMGAFLCHMLWYYFQSDCQSFLFFPPGYAGGCGEVDSIQEIGVLSGGDNIKSNKNGSKRARTLGKSAENAVKLRV